jgi:hypothetical protein
MIDGEPSITAFAVANRPMSVHPLKVSRAIAYDEGESNCDNISAKGKAWPVQTWRPTSRIPEQL